MSGRVRPITIGYCWQYSMVKAGGEQQLAASDRLFCDALHISRDFRT